MIEIELRGILKEKEYKETLDLFKQKAEFIGEKKRLSLVYFRDKVNEDVREVKDDPLDLRIRVTNLHNVEISLKYGKWGVEEARREIIIPIDIKYLDEAVDLLKFLGWKLGIVLAANIKVFLYKNIEFSIVKSDDHYYFEAEKVIKEEKDSDKINNEIKDVCKKLGLKIANEDEFMDMLNKMNTKKENHFDFSKHSFFVIRNKFKDYFPN